LKAEKAKCLKVASVRMIKIKMKVKKQAKASSTKLDQMRGKLDMCEQKVKDE
jgi:hypothetical protein